MYRDVSPWAILMRVSTQKSHNPRAEGLQVMEADYSDIPI